MNQNEFDIRLLHIKAKVKAGDNSYQIKTPDDIWINIGSNNPDIIFTELSTLYLEGNDGQRHTLYIYCGQQQVILDNLWLYIRRVGKQIHSKEDKKWLELGIASALINGNRTDFRDIIVSLVLLRFISERYDIDVNMVFETFIQCAPLDMKGMLKNVQKHTESDIHMIVQNFGPPEWGNESKKIFGKNNKHAITETK